LTAEKLDDLIKDCLEPIRRTGLSGPDKDDIILAIHTAMRCIIQEMKAKPEPKPGKKKIPVPPPAPEDQGPSPGGERKVYYTGIMLGDVVEAVRDITIDGADIKAGDRGVVVNRTELPPNIGVDWFRRVENGHAAGGLSRNGHGWYVYEYDIKAIWRTL
jgi:hypothetical protein